MKTFLIATLILASVPAYAAKTCGLPDTTENDELTQISHIDLGEASKREIEALDSLSRQQIFLAAQWDSAHVEGTWDAVQMFKGASEGGEVYLVQVRYGKERFTIVRYFPGDNEYGVIFKKGGRTVIATIGDGSIDCR
jgi:hypothetical protein